MVVLEHKTVGGKNKDCDQKTWVEKVAELGRRIWSDQDVGEIFDALIKDGCHDGQHLRLNKVEM